jgi:hypothetical protein
VVDHCWRSHSMTGEPSRQPSHTAIDGRRRSPVIN